MTGCLPTLRSVAAVSLVPLVLGALCLTPTAHAEARATPVSDYVPDVPETLEEIARDEERTLERALLFGSNTISPPLGWGEGPFWTGWLGG